MFWTANDYLYTRGRDPTAVTAEELAQEVALDVSKLSQCLEQRAADQLGRDLQEGLRLQLRGTPTFLVDGELHLGRVPPEILLDARSAAPRSTASALSHGP
jgi:predicted DsbA family dithiol-disulfide isomerase